MGDTSLTTLRVHEATSAEIPPMRALLVAWYGQLQRDER
jgi:hypothetical protein